MTLPQTELFPAEIELFRNRIDEQLAHYLQFDPGCPDHLAEAIRYCVLAPGKRIRPLLVLAAAQVCDGKLENAMPSACAVELIHNYSLIHDDLPAMDDDDIRRGRPTCHIQFDEPTAILAGDALIPLAFEIISRHTQPAETALKCVSALSYAAGASQLVGGQADDLNLQNSTPNRETLERIHRRKTGALLAVSLKLGAISAKAPSENVLRLTNYGKHLGLAFQIVDDLLDLRGSQAKMGKRTGKDSDRGKMTYPTVIGAEESESLALEMADRAITELEPFGDAATPLRHLARFVVDRTQ
jgi:geranylgeranyl diphosphate synthase type II